LWQKSTSRSAQNFLWQTNCKLFSMISDVIQFIRKYSERGTCRCGKCFDHPGVDKQPPGHTADLVFFNVCAKDNPDPQEFRKLIENNKQGEFCELDPWDGTEHGYIDVGGWIGDQGLALQFIGLGHLLGLWQIITPKMLPGLPDDLIMQMAGAGMVSIVPSSKPER
jgi:hypothetical protein